MYRFEELRNEKGLTKKALAELFQSKGYDIKDYTIVRLEKSQAKTFNRLVIDAYIDLFDTSYEYLFDISGHYANRRNFEEEKPRFGFLKNLFRS